MTPLPPAPDPTDPENFASVMDTFLAALVTFSEELDAYGEALALTLIGTSTTSVAVGTGSKSFTTQTGLGIRVGQSYVAAYTTTPTNRMVGSVTSYDSGTGALVLNVTTSEGSGTYTAWTISPTVVPDLNNQTFENATFTDFVETVKAHTAGTAFTLSFDDGTLHRCPTNGNATVTLPTPAAGKMLTVAVAFGGVHTLTWAVTGGSDIDWSDNDTIPTATSVNGRTDLFTFVCLDGSSWLGISGGSNYVQ